MPSALVQMLLDGGVEKVDAATGLTFNRFMDVSREEGGLLSGQQAAILLDVSQQRVVQLMDAGALTTWEFLGKRYVSGREVAARRVADVNKGGRPRRNVVQRLKAMGKVVKANDRYQVASAILD